jgi:hypothetical protein
MTKALGYLAFRSPERTGGSGVDLPRSRLQEDAWLCCSFRVELNEQLEGALLRAPFFLPKSKNHIDGPLPVSYITRDALAWRADQENNDEFHDYG